jgi:methionyl-tRNA formyltransferase
MKILFLGGNKARSLSDWLAEREDVIYTEDKIFSVSDDTDLVISYNYNYILTWNILYNLKRPAVNLHISLLPWNRGKHPILWGIINNTPQGVTIHEIDEGIDSGKILLQKRVRFDDTATLKSMYNILHIEIQKLFRENWDKLKAYGNIHYKRELEFLMPIDWNMTNKEFRELYENRR